MKVGEKSLIRNPLTNSPFCGPAQFPLSQNVLGFNGAEGGTFPQASINLGRVQEPAWSAELASPSEEMIGSKERD